MREQYVVVLEAMPDVDGIRALRFALKVLLRRFGLKAIKIEPMQINAPAQGESI